MDQQQLAQSSDPNAAGKVLGGVQQKLQQVLSLVLDQGKLMMEAFGFSSDELEFFYEYGLGLYNAGKYGDAKQIFFFLRQLNFSDPRFPFAYACCAYKLKDLESAIQYYSLAAFLDEENPLTWFNLGDCYLQRKEYHVASTMLENCIAKAGIHPDFAGVKDDAQKLLSVAAHHQEGGAGVPKAA